MYRYVCMCVCARVCVCVCVCVSTLLFLRVVRGYSKLHGTVTSYPRANGQLAGARYMHLCQEHDLNANRISW